LNLSAQARYTEAEVLSRQALAVRLKALGENHPDTVESSNTVAHTLHAQGKYAAAAAMWLQAADASDLARGYFALTGLDRAALGADSGPRPRLATVLARQDQFAAAWQRLEEDLARGLLDDLTAREARQLTPEEVKQEQRLLESFRRLDRQRNAFSERSLPMQRCRDESLADQVLAHAFAGGTCADATAAAIWQTAFGLGADHFQKLDRVQGQILSVQAQLTQLEKSLADKYGPPAGQVYDLGRIQGHMPAGTALIAWVDIKASPKAADPNGEHWACLVRPKGDPVWVRLPGSGAEGAWIKDDDELPGRVRERLRARPDDPLVEWQDLADRLAHLRLAPVQALLDGGPEHPAVRHLVVLPSPAMAGITIEALTHRYSISYAPSGTIFAWLQEQKRQANQEAQAAAGLLALGDPVPAPVPATPRSPPPDHGLFVQLVATGSNAARSDIARGDVLLSYADASLRQPTDLDAAMRKAAGQHARTRDTRSGPGIPVQVWRDGKTRTLTVQPGALGVGLSREPAAQAVRARREADAALRSSARGGSFRRLPGTRREVESIARLFQEQRQPVEKLLDSNASQQKLEELAAKRLGQFRYLHLATHGYPDRQGGLHSFLTLSQDHLPDPLQITSVDRPLYDGRLTAEQILHDWHLNADLVTLSACETGLGQYQGGEGYVGFAQALFLAGSRSLVLSLWKVDDRATALLMTRFYQNLLGQRPGLDAPLPKAAALAEAKRWLRGLGGEEADRLLAEMPGEVRGTEEAVKVAASGQSDRPYAHPYFWASFILVGDPGDVSQAVPVLAVADAPPDAGTAGWASRPWLWAAGIALALGLLAGIITARRRRGTAG
jgi:CHAT domain-containing protein